MASNLVEPTRIPHMPLANSSIHGPCTLGNLSHHSFLEHQKERKSLLSTLRGRVICVPDLRPLFKHWRTETNPEVDRMRADVKEWLASTIPPGKVLDALQASDFGLFGATWWPRARFEKLRIVTYLAVWLFTWDDEIDLSNGTLWNQFGSAQVYRDQTLAYVRYSLGIDERCPDVTNRIILNFAPIGAALRETYTLAQRKMVHDEMRFFMEMSEQEQRLRLSGIIPSIDDFWHYRLGSSAVTVCLALNEFSWENRALPAAFYADEDVKNIIRCTNTIISATNDLLSIKKEVKHDAVDSLIPIIFHHLGDLQKTITEIVEFIATEIRTMDEAAESLYRRCDEVAPKMKLEIADFVEGCKCYTTGNLTWSLETDRYGVEFENGEIVMTL